MKKETKNRASERPAGRRTDTGGVMRGREGGRRLSLERDPEGRKERGRGPGGSSFVRAPRFEVFFPGSFTT